MSAYIFDYSLDFKTVDFKKSPYLYRIGKGEQGVLLVEPYKSELLPLWKFKTVDLAQESAEAIYRKFEEYVTEQDFVGADMARKFLQMGFTRARRYANHPTGRKYATDNGTLTPAEYPYSQGSKYKAGNAPLAQADDALCNEKAQAAAIFKEYWFKAKDDEVYQKLKQEFVEKLKMKESER
ncbi:DUF4385 domain-containing protein [Runella sp.]|uniref:DUF4385 domain-containing protein n=1 Tax=Runella sp. TaxID=1960881 RepID=UPI003D0B801D